MTDTATKQRIKGDLDDRVDELEKQLESNRGVMRHTIEILNLTVNVTQGLKARIDKLEKLLADLPSMFKDYRSITAPFDKLAIDRLVSRLAALEQASGMDIERCVAGDEQALIKSSLGPTGAQLACQGIIKDEADDLPLGKRASQPESDMQTGDSRPLARENTLATERSERGAQ